MTSNLSSGISHTSIDHTIPRTAKITTMIIQIILEAKRLVPLSKTYWMPCKELDWLYSMVVVFTTSFAGSNLVFRA